MPQEPLVMTSAADTPNATALRIEASPNGKWILFDFTVGDKHAFVTMDTSNFPAAFQTLLATLSLPALATISGPKLPSYGYFSTEVVRPLQYASNITPLGQDVVIGFELPGAVQFHAALLPPDARQLQSAIEDAIQRCAAHQNLSKQ
jgi:hypothetical protein